MSWSVKLFSISGIDVKVHLTFVLILVWAAYTWGAAQGAGLAGALFGVVAMLLLFGCITLHELAHSLLALRYGVRVREIVLLPIGGVSQMEEMPGKPAQELWIALVGPLVSILLGAIFFVVAALVGAPSSFTAAGFSLAPGGGGWLSLVSYLAFANLILGLFNLIPAIPMDGGRVLRSLLALRFENRRATAIAVAIGQGLAFLIGVYGFLNGNFFLILIAVFVWLGAGEEGGAAEAKGALANLVVRDAMTRRPEPLAPGDRLARAVELTLTTAQADFPVVDGPDGRVVGLLTRQDLIRGLHERGPDASVGEAMRTTFATAKPVESLFDVQRRMRVSGVHVVPVVEHGALVGVLTTTDVSEAIWLRAATKIVKLPTDAERSQG
jgi:Zn-dependent protease/CBS domain-containing protein